MNEEKSKTPITDALRNRPNIARLGCEDLFAQLEKFELQLQEEKCPTPSSAP